MAHGKPQPAREAAAAAAMPALMLGQNGNASQPVASHSSGGGGGGGGNVSRSEEKAKELEPGEIPDNEPAVGSASASASASASGASASASATAPAAANAVVPGADKLPPSYSNKMSREIINLFMHEPDGLGDQKGEKDVLGIVKNSLKSVPQKPGYLLLPTPIIERCLSDLNKYIEQQPNSHDIYKAKLIRAALIMRRLNCSMNELEALIKMQPQQQDQISAFTKLYATVFLNAQKWIKELDIRQKKTLVHEFVYMTSLIRVKAQFYFILNPDITTFNHLVQNLRNCREAAAILECSRNELNAFEELVIRARDGFIHKQAEEKASARERKETIDSVLPVVDSYFKHIRWQILSLANTNAPALAGGNAVAAAYAAVPQPAQQPAAAAGGGSASVNPPLSYGTGQPLPAQKPRTAAAAAAQPAQQRVATGGGGGGASRDGIGGGSLILANATAVNANAARGIEARQDLLARVIAAAAAAEAVGTRSSNGVAAMSVDSGSGDESKAPKAPAAAQNSAALGGGGGAVAAAGGGASQAGVAPMCVDEKTSGNSRKRPAEGAADKAGEGAPDAKKAKTDGDAKAPSEPAAAPAPANPAGTAPVGTNWQARVGASGGVAAMQLDSGKPNPTPTAPSPAR